MSSSVTRGVVFRQRLTHLLRGVGFRCCGLYPQRRSALQPDQSLLPTVGGHQAEPVIVAGVRQQKELRVRMQVQRAASSSLLWCSRACPHSHAIMKFLGFRLRRHQRSPAKKRPADVAPPLSLLGAMIVLPVRRASDLESASLRYSDLSAVKRSPSARSGQSVKTVPAPL